MMHRTVVVVSAMLGVLAPGLVRGEVMFVAPIDDIGALSEEVEALAATKDYAAAAKLAAAGAAREDLDANTRVLLGGLARENFELSFAADHKLTDLCELAAVMRLVAPLDSKEGGALKLAVAADAEARLKDAAGEAWQRVCEPPSGKATGTSTDISTEAVPTAPSGSARAGDVVALQPPRPVDRANQRRMRAGLGTLVPGVLLFAPMIGVLAYRRQGEVELQGLWDRARGRPWTGAEEARANSLTRSAEIAHRQNLPAKTRPATPGEPHGATATRERRPLVATSTAPVTTSAAPVAPSTAAAAVVFRYR